MAATNAKEDAPAPSSDEAGEGPGRVLVVDDHPEVLRFQVMMLSRFGFDVSCSSDGAEALRLLRYRAFDTVISDISMPNLDGIQLLRAIRSRDPDLPVIIMTGGATIDTAIEAVEHGAFKYLLKPVEIERLVETTRQAVRLQRLARAKRQVLTMLKGEEVNDPARLGLAKRFDRALESLYPAFQPIVHASTGEHFGFEALLRSDEPSMPHPEVLLDAAQHLGRLRELGRNMRAASLAGAPEGTGILFLNLHPEDLNDPYLLDPNSMLSMNAHRIVLEVTERMGLEAVPNVREKVAALRRLGFRIAIDDLGAGFAGLTSFVSLEPDFVKLDMSLTRDIHRGGTRQKLVKSLASVCREMGMIVVAEGIETAEERAAVVELGCELLQGYHFGRPSRTPFG